MRAETFFVIAVAALGAGCGSECSDDFCVEIFDSGYQMNQPCGTGNELCNFAAVYFIARDKGQVVEDPSSLDVKLTFDDKDPGVESTSDLSFAKEDLRVDLMLDRSFSITESGSTDAVKTAALSFIDSLPDSAHVTVSLFASEANVPTELHNPDCVGETGSGSKTEAADIVKNCYAPYEAATSNSQTRLYDAIAAKAQAVRGTASVLVVFTDGTDTASYFYKTPGDVRSLLDQKTPKRRVYAVGLGSEPNEAALNTITDNHFVRASDVSALEDAFKSIAGEVTSIYRFRQLTAGPSLEERTGRLTVKNQGRSVTQSVDISLF